MCMFGGGSNITPPDPPVRYQQQKTPTRQDTVSAQDRAASGRKRATQTLLATTTETDLTGKKTLLGAA